MNDYDHNLLLKQLKVIADYEEARKQREAHDDDTEETPDDAPPPSITVPIPRGIYLYGDVGTGKSLLMNMFYNSSPPKKHSTTCVRACEK
jgi:predicted ATPase